MLYTDFGEEAADDALHSGDAGPRKALWSTKEPVTVFGAAMSATGPVETQATFDWVASRFTGGENFTPFLSLTGEDKKTVLSFDSFLVLLGHASLIGRSSTWNLVLHGLAASGISIPRVTGSVGEPRMTRLPSARVYSCGSFRLLM